MPLHLEDNMATRPTPIRASAHHTYKSWTSSWYDEQGHRRTKRFGRVDEVSRKAARAKFQNWLRNEWESKAHVRNPVDPTTYRVTDLCTAYRDYARTVYTKGERLTSHIDNVKAAMNALEAEYGQGAADDIESPHIVLLMEKTITGLDRHGVNRARSIWTLNGRLRIIKQAFKWARLKGLVSKMTAYDVAMVPPLRSGRCAAKPPKKVPPVPDEILTATLAAAVPTIADMIQTLLLTGMRPGELCDMRMCDIERDGDVWLYRPTSHKTEHHGKDRTVFVGPQAQAILKKYIGRRLKISEYIFLPVEAHAERLEQIGFPKVKAYQTSRSRFVPGRRFRAETFYGQVCRTCDRAFDPDEKLREKRDYSHRWHPHQLRHNAATRLRREFGIEITRDLLGHDNASTTLIYAERSIEKMKEVALKAG